MNTTLILLTPIGLTAAVIFAVCTKDRVRVRMSFRPFSIYFEAIKKR